MSYCDFVKRYFLLIKLMRVEKWEILKTYSTKLVAHVDEYPEYYERFVIDREKHKV